MSQIKPDENRFESQSHNFTGNLFQQEPPKNNEPLTLISQNLREVAVLPASKQIPCVCGLELQQCKESEHKKEY